jgi:hypothetical protein
MGHAVPSDFGLNDFNAALFADDAPVFHPLVFTAVAFIILCGAENFGAEKPVPLGLECPVVNGFRLFDLPVGPAADQLRRSKGNFNALVKPRIGRF